MMLKYTVLALVSVAIIASCGNRTETLRPKLESISESVYASGIIKSRNQYQVFSTVGGLIQKIIVKEGDVVKEGDPLFVIKNESSKLNAANAKLASDFATRNTYGDQLNELKGTVETSKSVMANDSLMLSRKRALWAQQAVTKVELEQSDLTYKNSSNNYRAAVSRYKNLQKQLGFAAAQSHELLSISKTLAQDYTIRSQNAGRVYSIAKEEGEIVNAQNSLATIGDASYFLAELQIDENDIVRITKGLRVLLTLDSYKGQVFEAQVSKIDPLMNERTRTFTIEAEFVKQPPVLYPNLTTEANIIIHAKEKTLTIPRAYVLKDSLVVLENKEQRKITIGLKDYVKVEVLSGLDTNAIIIKPTQ
jgi:HlyD family secretion protein